MRRFILAFAVAAVLGADTVQAVEYTWSGGPSGTWNTSDNSWGGLGTNTLWDATNGPSNVADFNSPGATATVSGTVYANGLTFDGPATITGGAAINLAGVTPTITTNANATISSILDGSAGLTKSGNSVLTLTTNNTYTGATTVNGGTLQTSAGNTPTGAIGNSSFIVVNSGGVISVGGDNSFVGGYLDSQTTIQINAGGAIVNNGSSTNHLVALVLNGGTLSAATANAQYGNWNFDLGVSTPGSGSNSAISGGNAALTQIGGTVFNIGAGDKLNVSGVLAHVIGGVGDTGLIKSGAGTLVLTGSNTYTGGTTISAGALQLGDGTAGHDGSIVGNIVNNATIVYNLNGSQIYSGVISGNGGLTKAGAGTLMLTSPQSYGGPTVVADGTLKLASTGQQIVNFTTVGTNTWADPAGATSVQYLVVGGGGGGGGGVGGGGGAGGFLTGSMSVSPGTVYTIVVGSGGTAGTSTTGPGGNGGNSSFGSSSSTTITAYGGGGGGADTPFGGPARDGASGGGGSGLVAGSVGISGQGNSGGPSGNWPPYSSGGGGGAGGPGGAGTAGGGVGGTGLSSNITGATVWYAGGGGGEGYGGPAGAGGAGGGGTGASSGDGTSGSPNTGGGGGGANGDRGGSGGSGIVVLSYLPGPGILPPSTALSIAAGSTLDLNSASQQVASLGDYSAANGGNVINSIIGSTSILTLSPTGGSTTFSGMIQGGGTLGTISLVLSGSGVQVLSGSNSYAGGTTISDGKLVVNGSLASPLTVNSGGILGGVGSLESVTVSASGQIAPGNPLGTLHVRGSLILASSAELDYGLDTPLTSDMVSCGNLVLSGQQFSDFNFTWSANFGPGTYNLIEAGSLPNGILGTSTSGMIAGYPATLAVQGNDLVLHVTPEPSTLSLLTASAIGLAGYVWRRRKRKHSLALASDTALAGHDEIDLQEGCPVILVLPSRWTDVARRAA